MAAEIFEMREIGMEYLVMLGVAMDGKPFYPSQNSSPSKSYGE
jgi:hypothetical protein